jgi:hypothetical protein
MKKYLKTTKYVLIAMCISIVYSCGQSGKTKETEKAETFEVKWNTHMLRVSTFQELPNDESKATGKRVQIGLDYVSSSGNQQSLLKSSVMENLNNFVLTDSKGTVIKPLDEISYKLASLSFDLGSSNLVEKLSYFALTYDIPESISIKDLSLLVKGQIIKLNKLLTAPERGIKK